MALITCPECGGKVSDQVEKCIHCGFPLKKYKEEQLSHEERRRKKREKYYDKNGNIKVHAVETTPEPKEVIEVKCPTCGSRDVKKVKNIEKVANIALFGYYGNKRKKQFHCNNCGYER